MSEARDGAALTEQGPAAAEGAVAPREGGEANAGDLLRAAREASGLHIAALAVALKVPVRKLEALETNQFHELPDAVFVRALAASVCRSLKIDSAPILQLLPASNAPRLVRDDGGLNAPFRSSGDVAAQTRIGQLSRPMVMAILALLVGALLLYFLPAAKTGPRTAASDDASASTPQATEPQARVAVEPSTPDVPSVSVGASASHVMPLAVGSAPVAATASVAAAAVVSAPVPAPAAAAMPATGLLVLQAKGESWVEVVDGKGIPTLRRLLAAGESVGIGGTLPLKVVVGRADMTTVTVRGKALDLAPVSLDNVARFEVK